jgi:hemerythrin-like domain-containing protein
MKTGIIFRHNTSMGEGGVVSLKPIGPLMREHRLIERFVPLMKEQVVRYETNRRVKTAFIETAVDFFRTYADRTHHGKEEDILFTALDEKELGSDLLRVKDELVQEHILARNIVSELADANERYARGDEDTLNDIIINLNKLIKLYPEHIEKEDKHFFYPCMEYFTKEEMDDMLREFWDFDRKMIHERYEQVMGSLEHENEMEKRAGLL